MHSPSLDGQPNRRVSFCKPKDECLAAEGENLSAEPSVSDLETWLEYQSTQIGIPRWWKELGAVPGITDQQKFTWKIWASFYIPEVRSRMFPEEGYSVPPAPQSLNRGAYLPDNLAYQDIRQWPALLTIAYCQCLQTWGEKCNLPGNPDFHPLTESVRELRQAVQEFMDITREDIMQDLQMEECGDGQQLSPRTIFSQGLDPQPIGRRQKSFPVGLGTGLLSVPCQP